MLVQTRVRLCLRANANVHQTDETAKSYQAAIFINGHQYHPNKYRQPIYIGYGHFALERYV
jgi:hypothetical protein